ncbi:hypothetical protein BC830DRAFT_221852 [Chytriomyces sp. MP71]|nr:hypothetical protein BC830DRAFT_221852 [Chytriomyces sp. MP71]
MDDDSYIFLDTMHNYLADFNASEPYYIGASNRFKGCGIKSYSESPRFAHGSAIVLSHVALKRLQPHIDKCIVDYQECFAGDVRTALCLRDAGINLTRAEGRGFWKFAPNHEFTWPKDPCSKPIVFHHLLSEQIQRLYTLERHPRNPHIGVTTSEIYHAFYTPKHKFDNIARRGEKPLAVHENATETACLDACVLDTECVVWTMEAGKCELFDQVFEGKPVDGAVSEVLPDRYICHVGI